MRQKGARNLSSAWIEDMLYQKIVDHISRYGYPPTIRWLQEELNMSTTSSVSYHLNQLEEQGRITRDKGVARGIRTVDNVVY